MLKWHHQRTDQILIKYLQQIYVNRCSPFGFPAHICAVLSILDAKSPKVEYAMSFDDYNEETAFQRIQSWCKSAGHAES